jgi:hypothetical protein
MIISCKIKKGDLNLVGILYILQSFEKQNCNNYFMNCNNSSEVNHLIFLTGTVTAVAMSALAFKAMAESTTLINMKNHLFNALYPQPIPNFLPIPQITPAV